MCGHRPGCVWDPVGRRRSVIRMCENNQYIAKSEEEDALPTSAALGNQE